jgi:hypothetical protein
VTVRIGTIVTEVIAADGTAVAIRIAEQAPTATSEDAYRFAADAFQKELERLRQLVSVDLKKIDDAMEASGAPWTPGRLPVWKPE